VNISKSKLLTRTEFRESVFARDCHLCVICKSNAKDAHHIIERRLWSDGGYYIDNGASVCETCHLKCEATTISVEDVREAAGITKIIVPDHLYSDTKIDKWGNPILANGQRLRGELFFDESVQKSLARGGFLDSFADKVKYPRTHHLPWSPGVNNDDRVLNSLSSFIDKRVIVTEKMDGENTTCYSDGYIHARSVDGRSHYSRDWVKNFWNKISYELPEGWRVCGENLFAAHSIFYDNLDTYFMGFSIWNENNHCLSWDDTLEWFDLLDIKSVPILYDGIFDEAAIKSLYDEVKDYETREGYVLRLAEDFSYSDFRKSVGKFVRKDHVRTTKHWMFGKPIQHNSIKE
jgi:hypothetical protein